MYPTIFGPMGQEAVSKEQRIARTSVMFKEVLLCLMDNETEMDKVITELLGELEAIGETLETDIEAAYRGDPAAKSREEIMLAYPSFEAVSIYRIAHKLYQQEVPILPRMMTEHAHSITGIDIHPGADIGPYFFIDHGTGVVIGETTTIGSHVKIYQGVTIGAKSFAVKEDGSLVKGIKRHPDIGDHVVIYAGATILSGDTQIGDRCIIGGNVWLTHSLAAGTTVVAAQAHEELGKAIE